MRLSKRPASAAQISCAKEKPSSCLLHADWMMLNNALLQLPHVGGETGTYRHQRFIYWLAWCEVYGAWRKPDTTSTLFVRVTQWALRGYLQLFSNSGLSWTVKRTNDWTGDVFYVKERDNSWCRQRKKKLWTFCFTFYILKGMVSLSLKNPNVKKLILFKPMFFSCEQN